MDERLVHQRMKDLQHAVTDLVGTSDTDLAGVLRQVAERAGYAINARRFLLVTRLAPGAAVQVHSDGFGEAEAAELGRQLMAGEPIDVDDTFIVAPVRSSTRDYGRIAAFAAAPFFDPERELLDAYAALAAAALDALVARQDAEERRHTAEVLLTFAERGRRRERRATPSPADRGRAARRWSGADAAAVLLLVRRGRGSVRRPQRLRAGRGAVRRAAVPGSRARTRRTSGRCWSRAGRTSCCAWTATIPKVTTALQAAGLQAVVGVGLHSPQRAHGVAFACWRPETGAPPADERLLFRLNGLASQATLALDKGDLLSQVRRQADTDDLTGLANRRCFVEELEAALAGPAAGEPVGALLFMDLDGFKAVNDTLGHAAGDELLRVVGARLTGVRARPGTPCHGWVATSSPSCCAARTPTSRCGSSPRGCWRRWTSRSSSAATPVRARPSIGAVLVHAGGDADEALRQADDAMYRAKAAGGRRLVLAEEPAA